MVSRTLKIVMAESKIAKANPGPLYGFHFMTELTESHQSNSTQPPPPGLRIKSNNMNDYLGIAVEPYLTEQASSNGQKMIPLLRDKHRKKEKPQTLGRKRNPKGRENVPGDQSQKETHYSPLDPIPTNGQMTEGGGTKP